MPIQKKKKTLLERKLERLEKLEKVLRFLEKRSKTTRKGKQYGKKKNIECENKPPTGVSRQFCFRRNTGGLTGKGRWVKSLLVQVGGSLERLERHIISCAMLNDALN